MLGLSTAGLCSLTGCVSSVVSPCGVVVNTSD